MATDVDGANAFFCEMIACAAAFASAISRGSIVSDVKSSRKCCSTEREPVAAVRGPSSDPTSRTKCTVGV